MNGAIVEAALNLGLSLTLVYWYGLIGVAIGTLVANLFRTAQFSYFVYKKIILKNYWQFIRRIVWLAGNISASLLICNVCSFTVETWMGWVLYGALCFIIAVLITLITSFAFYRSDMTTSLKVMGKILTTVTKRKGI